MLKVIIEKEGLSFLTKLEKILRHRQAYVEFTSGKRLIDQEKGQFSEICFICSKRYLQSINGITVLIEKAKNYSASSIIVINNNDDIFSIKEELGGKLLKMIVMNMV